LAFENHTLTIFPRNDIYVRYLADNRQVIGELATEFFGCTVKVELAGPGAAPHPAEAEESDYSDFKIGEMKSRKERAQRNRSQEEKAMAFEAKPNSCGLFKNTRNDKSDFGGKIEIECPHCHTVSGWWVNLWKRVSKSGLNYLHLGLKPRG